MIDIPFTLALTAGMVATVNPCGFAMLPAYLAYFLGIETSGANSDAAPDSASASASAAAPADARAGVARALIVGLAVTTGFALTFGATGLVVSHLTSELYDWTKWITIGIGIALVALGIAMLAGFEPSFALPRLDKGGRTREVRSMVLFGVSYAVASCGCTLPVFLSLVGVTFREMSLVSGLATFGTYALGMGLVLTALAVSLAFAHQWLVQGLRRLLPHVHRLAGALLLVTGAYVAYYGTFEVRVGPGATGDRIVDPVTSLSSDVTNWLTDVGVRNVALVLGAVVALATTIVLWRRGTRAQPAPEPEPSDDRPAATPRAS